MGKWYKKIAEGIPTSIIFKKGLPDGVWDKCPQCNKSIAEEHIEEQYFVCNCGHHFRIGSGEYFRFLFDDGNFEELFTSVLPSSSLSFDEKQPYHERLQKEQEKSGLSEAIRVAHGKLNGFKLVISSMDFTFIGGSMGSVVGEKISRAIDYCIAEKAPLVIIARSVGARMMEASYALMQMAKTSAKLVQLGKNKIPYISVLTDPTIGGVTASFGMKGDVILAEPNATICYTGPKVIKETTGKDLPKGFQRSEFVFKNGFIDQIVERKNLKSTIASIIQILN